MLTSYAAAQIEAGTGLPASLYVELICYDAASGTTADPTAALWRNLTDMAGANHVPANFYVPTWTSYAALGPVSFDTKAVDANNQVYEFVAAEEKFVANSTGSNKSVRRVAYKDGAGMYWLVSDTDIDTVVAANVQPDFAAHTALKVTLG